MILVARESDGYRSLEQKLYFDVHVCMNKRERCTSLDHVLVVYELTTTKCFPDD